MHFTEDMFEQAVIELLENMGYTHIYAPDMERDYSSPLLDSVLMDSLVKLNKGLPLDAINEAINKLRNFDTGSLLQKNMQFMDYLQNGVPVRYFVKGEERTSIVYLIDYKNVQNNSFYAVNQFTYIENGNNRRPDIILFINGLPLVLMELKSPSKDDIGATVVAVFDVCKLIDYIEAVIGYGLVVDQIHDRSAFFTFDEISNLYAVLQVVHELHILLQ